MSTDLQDLLREGLDRLTAGATAPDGLVGRAQQHNRQRRTKIRAAIDGLKWRWPPRKPPLRSA